MYHNLETKIEEDVKVEKPDYYLNDEVFDRDIPVADTEKTIEDTTAIIVVITDEEFAKERLRVAKKHVRDYENLPDKGQFPYIEFKENKKLLVFNGRTFIPDVEEAKDTGRLTELNS